MTLLTPNEVEDLLKKSPKTEKPGSPRVCANCSKSLEVKLPKGKTMGIGVPCLQDGRLGYVCEECRADFCIST